MSDTSTKHYTFHQLCESSAKSNTEKWGRQDIKTLALCLAEECGEVAQACLKFAHEDGCSSQIVSELVDVGALLVQMINEIDRVKGCAR